MEEFDQNNSMNRGAGASEPEGETKQPETENISEAGSSQPQKPEENADAAEQRNTRPPAGWSYSASTNQYVSWDGSPQRDPGEQWQPQAPQQGQGQQSPPQQNSYGTQYGYYSNRGVDPQYSKTRDSYRPQQENYQWDFAKYDNADHAGKQKKKTGGGKGFRVFLGIVSSVLGVCVIALASYGVYNIFFAKDAVFSPQQNDSSSTSDPENPVAKPETETPPLTLSEKPEDGDAIVTGGILTAKQIYKLVGPSVVGVVQYQYATSLQPAGEGSGIIISGDGYIVTNAHVVLNADAIKVVLFNNQEYEAKLIGVDEQTDLAVIKIDEENLTPASLGDSNDMEVGDTVYALGNPGGLTLQSSFTDGIISGINRVINTSESAYSMKVIQTNAAINPGNSGGALVNEYGQVVGITSSKLISTSYEGIGFAIPTSEAIGIVKDLIAQGYVPGRPIIGVTVQTIDSVVSQMYGVPQGVQIKAINERSSLTGTEATLGDIIIAMDDADITNMAGLQNELQKHKPGDSVTLTLYRYSATGRADKTFTVKIVLLEDIGTNKVQESPLPESSSKPAAFG